jgi:hypothetical protein
VQEQGIKLRCPQWKNKNNYKRRRKKNTFNQKLATLFSYLKNLSEIDITADFTSNDHNCLTQTGRTIFIYNRSSFSLTKYKLPKPQHHPPSSVLAVPIKSSKNHKELYHPVSFYVALTIQIEGVYVSNKCRCSTSITNTHIFNHLHKYQVSVPTIRVCVGASFHWIIEL